MKKLWQAIKDWWIYQILKKEKVVEETRYNKGYKNGRPFYMKKTYKNTYVGKERVNSIKIDQKFVSKAEYEANFNA